jgi:hypothetical protein
MSAIATHISVEPGSEAFPLLTPKHGNAKCSSWPPVCASLRARTESSPSDEYPLAKFGSLVCVLIARVPSRTSPEACLPKPLVST